jgi:hypothetical protein
LATGAFLAKAREPRRQHRSQSFSTKLSRRRSDAPRGDVRGTAAPAFFTLVVGQLYEAQSTHAYEEIVKYQNGLPLKQWLDAPAAKTQAEDTHRKSSCSLIQ